MNLLLAAVPWYYRVLAVLLLSAAMVGFGYLKGSEHGQAKIDKMVAAQVVATVKLARARDIVTTVVQTKYVPQIAKAEVITETIIKEVPTYVPSDTCALPGGFRVFHDAAAQGRIPDPAGVADAAAVPAEDAAATIAANYGECTATQLKLQGLQEWITNQQKVTR